MVTSALARIAPSRPGVPFQLYAAAGGAGGERHRPRGRRAGAPLVQTPDWREGGEASVTVKNGAGARSRARGKFAAGDRIVRVDVPIRRAGRPAICACRCA